MAVITVAAVAAATVAVIIIVAIAVAKCSNRYFIKAFSTGSGPGSPGAM